MRASSFRGAGQLIERAAIRWPCGRAATSAVGGAKVRFRPGADLRPSPASCWLAHSVLTRKNACKPTPRRCVANLGVRQMKEATRYLARAVVSLVIFCPLVLWISQLLPQPSNQEFHDFMLVSMGMAFVPFFLVLICIAAALGILAFVSVGIAMILVPKRKVTVLEAWQRKSERDRRRHRM